ncbi:MAG: hypothetical protein AB2L14_09870 [Candidatus Xenobiia bacterium LiM19]
MINIQNFQQTDYTNAATTTLSSDIKELKEKVTAIEAKIATNTDAFAKSPGIESIPDRKAVANVCQETPHQNIKGKGLLPGVKTAATLITGFTTGFVMGKIAEEAEKAIKESDKNNVSSTKHNKENVTTGNAIKPDAYAEKNAEELSSEKVKGFNVRSCELPDVDEHGPILSDSPIGIRQNIEEMIREYAAYDETCEDDHKELPGDVRVKDFHYEDDNVEMWDPHLEITKYIDIKFDPESNILESFNMRENFFNRNNGDKRTISTCSAEDKGNYIIYKRYHESDYGADYYAAVKYNKKTHKTTNAGFLDKLL